MTALLLRCPECRSEWSARGQLSPFADYCDECPECGERGATVVGHQEGEEER